jgi:glycosyltransferase involved in cell wall biosynthesis
MKFSIILPVYVSDDKKKAELRRAIDSIQAQTFDHHEFELIVVNDGSQLELTFPCYPFLRVIYQENLQRMTATNTGLRYAKGDVICLLDSDDEYVPEYLEEVDRMYQSFPEYKMFNFGSIMCHKDIEGKEHENNRGPFKPKELEVGHEVFGGGNIVKGTYVFHRSVYEDLGAFPPHDILGIDCTSVAYPTYTGQPEPLIRDLHMTSPYDFSAYAQLQYPEIQKYFMVKHPDHPKNLVRELGNPFGDDFFLFYKFTRTYHSKPIDLHLYKAHVK